MRNLSKSKRRKRSNRGAPSLGHGFARGIEAAIEAVVVSLLIVVLQQMSEISGISISDLLMYYILLLTLNDILNIFVLAKTSRHWPYGYLIGRILGLWFGIKS